MKPGTRALGIAESHADGTDSTVAGAVVRADRVLDGLAFSTITVGGTDSTDRYAALVDDLDRPDVRYVLLAGVAPAWFNVVDVDALAARCERPVVAVSFEASDGLADDIGEQFVGGDRADRLATYDALPERRRLVLGDGNAVFVRNAGCGDGTAARVVRAFTPEGGRPEPLRVARLAARAADAFVDASVDDPADESTDASTD